MGIHCFGGALQAGGARGPARSGGPHRGEDIALECQLLPKSADRLVAPRQLRRRRALLKTDGNLRRLALKLQLLEGGELGAQRRPLRACRDGRRLVRPDAPLQLAQLLLGAQLAGGL